MAIRCVIGVISCYRPDPIKKPLAFANGFYGIRRRPTLPGRYQPSTIGTEGLNFCVRYGNRWDPFVIATGNGELFISRILCAS